MHSIDVSTLGRRIRVRREALKLTQGQLALMAGISQPSLSDIEQDKTKEITARTLGSLCRALGIAWEYALYGANDYTAEEAQEQAELLAIYRALPSAQARASILGAARAVIAAMEPGSLVASVLRAPGVPNAKVEAHYPLLPPGEAEAEFNRAVARSAAKKAPARKRA